MRKGHLDSPDGQVHDRASPLEAGVLERFPDPVVAVDARRTVTAANRAARDLLAPNPLGRDLAFSLRHPEALAGVDAALASAADRAVEVTLPGTVPRHLDLRILAFAEAAARPGATAAVLVFRDVTSTRRSEQMRADFVANVSHELRSPLSAMVGFIETLMGPARDDKEAQERFLAIMHGEAQRMSRLIADLLSLSRVEADEHIQPTGRADVPAILAAVREALAPRAAEHGMTVVLACEDGLPDALGDPDQLHQVFRNLIDNAIGYGRDGTEVRVAARHIARLPGRPGPGIEVSVTDHGEGIPEADLPRLTERFYRIDKGRSRSLGGTGLGLAIVKHIVSRHRGALRIESEVGRGSTFTVSLPAA